MIYKDMRTKVKETAKMIIDMQFDDTKSNGINNHFLMYTIEEIVKQQAPKIKQFVDALFLHNDTIDDQHSVDCTIHLNNNEKSVLTIWDNSLYGPNLNHIIVIDDKVEGKLHIRQLKYDFEFSDADILEYKERNFEVFGDNFMSHGFIFTYEYSNHMVKMLEKSASPLNDIERMRKIESMGDNVFKLYEKVVYSTSLLANMNNRIKTQNL